MNNKVIPVEDALLPETISPEGLSIADAYLQNGQDAKKTAIALQINEQEVRRLLKTAEVRTYVNAVFMESGFRNRNKMFTVLDEVIQRKLDQMEKDESTSEKDILEIMVKYHSMKMAEMKMEKELHEAKAAPSIGKQNNVQVNIGSGDKNYDSLISTLAKGSN